MKSDAYSSLTEVDLEMIDEIATAVGLTFEPYLQDDCRSESMLACMKSFEVSRTKKNQHAFLRTVALNASIDYVRRHGHTVTRPRNPDREIVKVTNIYPSQLEQTQAYSSDELDLLIEDTTDNDLEESILRLVAQDFTQKEVAEALDIGIEAVAKNMQRIRVRYENS